MRWALLLALFSSVPEWASAQAVPVVHEGSRVRLTMVTRGTATRIFEGRVESIAGDTITMRSSRGSTQRYTPARDVQLHVLSGHRSSILRGGSIGGLVGMLSGGVWGLVRQSECTGANKNLCINRKPLALKEGVILGAAGAITGIVLGALDRQEVWSRAWTPEVAMVETPGTRGLNLGISLAF
jgi:hypothetical protein